MKLNTIYNKKIEIPSKKDCRVDYRKVGGKTWSFLVVYGSEDKTIYFEASFKTLHSLYLSFKLSVINEFEIDNYPYYFMPSPFAKLENLKYLYLSF